MTKLLDIWLVLSSDLKFIIKIILIFLNLNIFIQYESLIKGDV